MSTLATQPVRYDPAIEAAAARIAGMLATAYAVDRRALALLLIQGDTEAMERVRQAEGDGYPAIEEIAAGVRQVLGDDPETVITLQRHGAARSIAAEVMSHPERTSLPFTERLSRMCTSPVTGVPILALVLWFGLYQFVGVFGGGTLVGWLEKDLFQGHLNPWMTGLVQRLIPWPWVSSLFVGEYGMWTLGVTYAVALIFPIVGTFFLAFSVMEDSGYLPRLAMLVDRLFKRLGLSGKAVIPIVLGFGCDTMATLVTRILETRRERIIATLLLSLAIPCAAQMGVMTALLAGHGAAFAVWALIMTGIFVLAGFLSSQLMPGDPVRFAMEMPPLRWPSPANIVIKTVSRMQWYFMEVFPLFLLASFAIWLGQLTGLFGVVVRSLQPLTGLLGLPPKTAEAFLFGFFRRDYGAAGLYRMQQSGALDGNQLLVSVVTLTIFLPCIAQFLMIKKERGPRMAFGMMAFILPFALVVGAGLNVLLKALHVHL